MSDKKSQRSIFKSFIKANEDLIACYEAADIDQYKDQPASKSSGLCLSQKQKVKDIINSNELRMTNLVNERVGILRHIDATKTVKIHTDEDLRGLM